MYAELYIECCPIAQTIAIECTHCMPFSNISFSHFAVSFPGLVPHVLLMAGSLILLPRSAGGWVATYVSHKRPSLGHMGKPSHRECIHARAHIRSIAAVTKQSDGRICKRMNNSEYCCLFLCSLHNYNEFYCRNISNIDRDS